MLNKFLKTEIFWEDMKFEGNNIEFILQNSIEISKKF